MPTLRRPEFSCRWSTHSHPETIPSGCLNQLSKAGEIPDATVRERVLADIEQTFGTNELDYGRKLYLIENCIYFFASALGGFWGYPDVHIWVNSGKDG